MGESSCWSWNVWVLYVYENRVDHIVVLMWSLLWIVQSPRRIHPRIPIYCPRLSKITLQLTKCSGAACVSAIASLCLRGKCAALTAYRGIIGFPVIRCSYPDKVANPQWDWKPSVLPRHGVGLCNHDWLSGNIKLGQDTVTTLSGSSGR